MKCKFIHSNATCSFFSAIFKIAPRMLSGYSEFRPRVINLSEAAVIHRVTEEGRIRSGDWKC